MTETRDMFEARRNELTLFLRHLTTVESSTEFSLDFCNILYSNALLMMYNLVEATVIGGILEIYDAVKGSEHNYRLVSSKIQSVWFSYKFNQVYDRNAHHNSYKEKAQQIIDAILNDHVLELNRYAINVEGNLDAQIIRNVCDAHGIRFTPPRGSRGGVKIAEVRDLRNALAHGGKSFVECGRDFTLADLKKITEEIEKFLEGLLDGMSEYYDNQKWKSAPSHIA